MCTVQVFSQSKFPIVSQGGFPSWTAFVSGRKGCRVSSELPRGRVEPPWRSGDGGCHTSWGHFTFGGGGHLNAKCIVKDVPGFYYVLSVFEICKNSRQIFNFSDKSSWHSGYGIFRVISCLIIVVFVTIKILNTILIENLKVSGSYSTHHGLYPSTEKPSSEVWLASSWSRFSCEHSDQLLWQGVVWFFL